RDNAVYETLKAHAMSLGAAFQKVNFLRDLHTDQEQLGRTYFPSMPSRILDHACKMEIEKSIEEDFRHGLAGIKKLPQAARWGVYLAYMYYLALFEKIKNTSPEKVLSTRIRIANRRKATLLAYSFVRHKLNLI